MGHTPSRPMTGKVVSVCGGAALPEKNAGRRGGFSGGASSGTACRSRSR